MKTERYRTETMRSERRKLLDLATMETRELTALLLLLLDAKHFAVNAAIIYA